MIRLLFLAATTLAFAADLPPYQGFVNDFAGQLAARDQAALENRLQAYEQESTNEVVVAIVPSLDGEGLETYAQRLFRAWGIGNRERNNGVLLLWVPGDRKVRIQVGYGLEGTLSDAAAADVVRDITDRFKHEDWVGGLNAGIDGIIDRLDGAVEPRKPRSAFLTLGLPLAMAAGLIAIIVATIRRMRLKSLSESLPRDLLAADRALGETEAACRQAGPALEQLKRETPRELWQDLVGAPETASPSLEKLRQKLSRIQAEPRGDLAELGRANRALKKWNRELAPLRTRLEAAGQRLQRYRTCLVQCPEMLREIGENLESRGPERGRTRETRLLKAARKTYDRACSLSTAPEVNWLLVYDLLVDVRDCLESADNPARYSRRERYWQDSEDLSPGYAVLSVTPSSSGSDSSGSSGGDSGGGGDCGGGGASGSY